MRALLEQKRTEIIHRYVAEQDFDIFNALDAMIDCAVVHSVISDQPAITVMVAPLDVIRDMFNTACEELKADMVKIVQGSPRKRR